MKSYLMREEYIANQGKNTNQGEAALKKFFARIVSDETVIKKLLWIPE